MLNHPRRNLWGVPGLALLTALSALTTLSVRAADTDIPKAFAAPTSLQDYVKREAMIPMRDGVKLYTVIVAPKGARNAPILLTRTPYNASKRAQRNNSEHMLSVLPLSDEVFVQAGGVNLPGRIKPVEVEVEERQPAAGVGIHQREGWGMDAAFDAEAESDSLDQLCFAGAEFAFGLLENPEMLAQIYAIVLDGGGCRGDGNAAAIENDDIVGDVENELRILLDQHD